MIRLDAFAGAVLALIAFSVSWQPSARPAAPPELPQLHARFAVVPASTRVFAGGSVQFRVAAAGTSTAGGALRWKLVGPGSVDANGLYHAPDAAPGNALVIATENGSAAVASATIVAPPGSTSRLTLVSCYDGAAIDVRDAVALSSVGTSSLTNGAAAGIAADARRRLAYIASGDELAAFDLRTAATVYSAPVAGSRFSEVALLANGYVAATDNNALRGSPGVRIFRIGADAAPVLSASVRAGDTPEGITVARGGRTFYVTNVNSNSVIRFDFDGRGSAHATGFAATGHRPFGLAIDDARRLLFVADNDTPTVSGSASLPGLEEFALPSMRRIARMITGSPNALPLGVAIDSNANRLFVTNEGDGTVSAYSIAPLRRLATLQVGRTPWLPTLDRAHRDLYVPTAMANSFSVFDERSLRPIARNTPTCGYPTGIAVF